MQLGCQASACHVQADRNQEPVELVVSRPQKRYGSSLFSKFATEWQGFLLSYISIVLVFTVFVFPYSLNLQ
jgi:hypothetical protein